MRKILLPPVLLVLCIGAMLGMREFLPVSYMNFGFTDTLASLFLGGGVALPLWGAWLFQRHKTNIKPYNDPDNMVTDGPFRFSRNPMYLGMLLILFAAVCKVGFWEAFILPVLFFCVANWWYIPFEEKRMQATFGEAYDSYRKKVRRWI